MMATTQTAVFTSSGDWVCPAGVSAVWATKVGGGGATCSHFSQGGGSGEIAIGIPVPVVPGNTYAIVVGNGGTKSLYGVRPTGQSKSSFAGFNALAAGLSSTGGGAGTGGIGGGVGGRFQSDGGANPRGIREGCHHTGGCGGSVSGAYFFPGNPIFKGVNAGIFPTAGLPHVGGSNSGGAGAGAIWGGTDGANDYINHAPPDMANKNAAANHYGAGGGGPGNTPEDGRSDGGNGAPGYVLLMWVG